MRVTARVSGLVGLVGLLVGLAVPAAEAACPPRMVAVGPACIDKFEASVWATIDPVLAAAIKDGSVTLPQLLAGATQLGLAPGDLAANGCPDNGNGCKHAYAVSIRNVLPARHITWFQAAAAARNAGKRLPTNAEWQAAALGTPDGAPCIVNAGNAGPTGTAGCVSDVKAFDMVGNLWEWVADWVPLSTTCGVPALFGTGDANCLAGASTTAGPGALIRGGAFGGAFFGTFAGVFAVHGASMPSDANFVTGFRAAR